MSEPVEVWCVYSPTNEIVGMGPHKDVAWKSFDVLSAKTKQYLESRGYRCERRMLVRPGETWQDGVEACIGKLREIMQDWKCEGQSQKVYACEYVLEVFSGISPSSMGLTWSDGVEACISKVKKRNQR